MPSKRAVAVSRAPPASPPSRASSQRASKLPCCCDAACTQMRHCIVRRHSSQIAHSLPPPFQSRQPRPPGAPSPSPRLAHAPQLQVSSSTSPRTHRKTVAPPPCYHSIAQLPRGPSAIAPFRQHSSSARAQHSFARAQHRRAATACVTQLTLTLCRQVAACSLRACRRPHACKSHRRPAQATSTLRFRR